MMSLPVLWRCCRRVLLEESVDPHALAFPNGFMYHLSVSLYVPKCHPDVHQHPRCLLLNISCLLCDAYDYFEAPLAENELPASCVCLLHYNMFDLFLLHVQVPYIMLVCS